MWKGALFQLSSTENPKENLEIINKMITTLKDIGEKELKKVVCGATNAREGLITIYAPPGAIVPKTKAKLIEAKIRGVTSYGMLCSESELNLSNESDGITELSKSKYDKRLGSLFSSNKFKFLNAFLSDIKKRKVTPDAHRYFKSDSSSNLFGLIIEWASGS